jgi:hypothetical protein
MYAQYYLLQSSQHCIFTELSLHRYFIDISMFIKFFWHVFYFHAKYQRGLARKAVWLGVFMRRILQVHSVIQWPIRRGQLRPIQRANTSSTQSEQLFVCTPFRLFQLRGGSMRSLASVF